MNINHYLERIRYSGDLNLSVEVLRALQESHLLTVPFENLDVHYGRAIELDLDRIYKKVVLSQRGGFCYELNGLFYELLKGLGFQVKRISARIFARNQGSEREFDHLVTIARLDDRDFLLDVGFGEFTLHPLTIKPGIVQQDPRGNFIIEKHEGDVYRVDKIENGEVEPQYLFTLKERELSEFQEMCRYHQTHPESFFTRQRLISLARKNGRVTIAGNKLKISESDRVEEIELENEAMFESKLKEYFGVTLDF
ncbi:arylamine N-acetyltransferase family protein [Baaleninema simplex]|uniref:arylamine N-acetyltransferase family protein n=1 Tax=Baaleninema simplex TaxID=2862350 RepID=UPI00034D1B7E|nr:arylamine N-acetyltransferase [Baaleninema simplex]